jgi:hypothetical protein
MNALDLTAIHQKMVRNVFLNIEILLNDGVHSLSEYDVQAFAFLYFTRALLNTPLRCERELVRRVDCVVFEGDQPRIIYEMKTFFKPHERMAKSLFDKDIKKMADLLTKHNSASAYFLIAGSREAFASEKLEEFHFISQHIHENDRTWLSYEYEKDCQVRLRPSQKQHRGQSVLITWEIKI